MNKWLRNEKDLLMRDEVFDRNGKIFKCNEQNVKD